MNARVSLLLFLAACPKAPTDPAAAPGPDAPLPVDPHVRTGTLDNGMRWYIEVNREPEKRAVFRLAVDAGSVLEDDDQLGVAHFVEHMAFNGSEHFAGNELIEYLESVGTRFGAHLNAHTSVDETVYKLTVPTDDPAILDKAFVVFDDWAGGLKFDTTEIEKERGVVLEEWRTGRGAGARIGDALRPLTMQGSPYPDRKTIGTEESLKTFTPDAARRFYQDWYRPDLMAIIVVGDLDPDYAEAKIKEHFSDLEAPAEPRERVRPTIPDHDETLVAVLTDRELTRTSVGITHKHDDIERATYGSYRENLVDRLISRMVNERFDAMSREPDAPFLGAGANRGKMTPIEGSTSVGASTTETGALTGLRAIATEVERVRRHGFLPGELKRAIDQELRTFRTYYDERETTDSNTHADEIVRVFLTGESMPGIEKEWELTQQFAAAITLDEVNARAKSAWMLDHSRVVAVTMPQKDGLVPPTEAEVRAVLAEVAAADIPAPVDDTPTGPLIAELPTPGSVTTKTELPGLGTSVWTLSNGAHVYLKPTDFKADEVLLRGFSVGGYAKVPDAAWIPAVTATEIAGASGLGAYDAVQLQRLLAGRKVGSSPWIGAHHEGINGSASPEDLETLFQLVHLQFTQPRFDADALEVRKRARAEGLRNRLSDPNTVYGDRFEQLVWQGHPRHVPWTVETLEKMDLEASKAAYLDRFADASDFTFTLVGTFDPAVVEPLIAQYLATLPNPERDDPWGDDGARRATGLHTDTVKAGNEPKGRWSMVIHGPFQGSWVERSELSALREVLSVMLRKKLREELGGVYGVGVNTNVWQLPEPGYELSVGFQCDPDRVAELEAATLAVLKQVVDQGVNPDDVADVKAKNTRGLETDLRDNGWWAGGIDAALRRGEDPLELLNVEARNQALTAEKVNAAAKRWVNLDQQIRLTLLPEG